MEKIKEVEAKAIGDITQAFNLDVFRKLLTSETSRQTSLLFAAQILSTALNAASSAVIGRTLGKEKFGIFIFCSISIVQFSSYFFDFGISPSAGRLLAIAKGKQGERRMLGAMLILAALIGVIFSLFIAFIAEFIDPIFHTNVEKILLVAVPLCAAIPFQLFIEQACQGFNRIGALALLRLLLPIITITIVIAALFGLHGGLTPLIAVLASLSSVAVSCSVLIVLLKPSFVSAGTNIQRILSETRRFGLNLYIGRITAMASTKFDSILIPAFLGSTTFGLYAIAQKFAEILNHLSRSMAITRFKVFANESSVRRTIIQLNLLIVASGALALILLGPFFLVLIYGREFALATQLMLPFAVGAFFGGLMQPYNNFLVAHGRGGELRNISFFIGAVNVISLTLIIPRFGVMGAAWMVASASALNFSLHYFYYSSYRRAEVLKNPSRIAIVHLTNDTDTAVKLVRERFGAAAQELISKNDVLSGSKLDWIRKLRASSAEIFIVFCDRIEWQTRRAPMFIFGLLAGAEETLLLDSQGESIVRSRWKILFAEIPRFIFETLGATAIIAISWFITSLLKRGVKQNPPYVAVRPHDRRPRIVFLRTTPTNSTPGGETAHINGFAGGILSLKSQLHFLANDRILGIDDELTPIEVKKPSHLFNADRMIFELWNNLQFASWALERINALKPDFIYQRYSRFSWAGAAISYLTGIPLLLEYNGSEVWLGRNWDGVRLLWLLERFEKLNLLAAQYVFVVSEVEKNNLLRAGVPERKVIVNPNGVDADLFKPDSGGAEVRSKLGVEEKIVIGFAGTFCPWHGMLVLADAIPRLPREARCHFLLMGDGNLKADVESAMRSNGTTDCVTFTGRLPHKLMPAYLDACDILISPHVPMEDGSEFFGSPTKLFEYMAQAKPIVASRLGQIGDVIKDGENGYLLEPGDADALIRTILKLAGDPTEREKLGKAARSDAMQNYTWTRNAERVIEAYESLALDNEMRLLPQQKNRHHGDK